MGLNDLRQADPERASRVEERVAEYVVATRSHFPGDPETGVLGEDEGSQAAFEDFENERACPVLDPESQTCDLYSARPMTCRVFGPPVRGPGGLGVCELCYAGATEEEIAGCEMTPDPDDLESRLLAELTETDAGTNGCYENGQPSTIVGYAFLGERDRAG